MGVKHLPVFPPREETHTSKIKQLFKKMGAAEGGHSGVESSLDTGVGFFVGEEESSNKKVVQNDTRKDGSKWKMQDGRKWTI